MTIIAVYQSQQVEVLDVYTTGGRKYAAVKALEGRPFVGGDKWPVLTEWATAPADELANIHQDPQPEPTKPNLLTLALTYQNKAQWASGESITLFCDPSGRPLAWLKNHGGRVVLQAKGVRGGAMVYLLTAQGCQLSRTVGADYHRWAAKAQANR